MANTDVKQLKIARRYSEALIDTAKKENKLQEIFAELKNVEDVLSKSQDLKDFLVNPIIKNSDKKDVIEKVFENNVSLPVFNFLKLLVDNSRFDAFDSVVFEYSEKLDSINNIVKVGVVSAVVLDDSMKSKIIEKLEHKISKKVVANYEINPEIIAGLIIKISDKTIDSSLKTKLSGIKRQLI